MFFMFFHMCLKAMLFSCKTNHHMVFILIMGGQNVAISLVLGMILEIHVFSQVQFQ